ncbi:tumor necrosis factor ligand superfamily member 10-like [Rhineura floridana]|uniref:tumor necrosis factor ligand superfamily member 10-like n=1 Tax=Rhineura floridana TaxID=261503 RepID=UPI002AC7EE15|nr:tumor necrosis factor ligand superfamily member 10-like [Rhineura floridana]
MSLFAYLSPSRGVNAEERLAKGSLAPDCPVLGLASRRGLLPRARRPGVGGAAGERCGAREAPEERGLRPPPAPPPASPSTCSDRLLCLPDGLLRPDLGPPFAAGEAGFSVEKGARGWTRRGFACSAAVQRVGGCMPPWRGARMAQAAPPSQQYFRSDSSDSAARMLGAPDAADKRRRRKKCCRPAWLAVAAMGILALQIASTTGLFVYFTMSIAKLKAQAQGSSEELRCLLLLNGLQELSDLEELIGSQACLKLAGNIKDYVTMVTENVIRKSAQSADSLSKHINSSGGQLESSRSGSRPTAHLTLRRQSPAQAGGSLGLFGELPQSCQHPIPYWANRTMHSHLQNLTYQDGKLHISQAGKYYIYAQIYFRYPTEGTPSHTLGHQLVQCINLQSSYGQNLLLLKGVGTKCWAQDATYGLYALYQGGLFDLRAGDKLFVSVSSLDVSYNDEAASYFGAFRLDV